MVKPYKVKDKKLRHSQSSAGMILTSAWLHTADVSPEKHDHIEQHASIQLAGSGDKQQPEMIDVYTAPKYIGLRPDLLLWDHS